MGMMRTVFTAKKNVGDVVGRLVQHYDRILVERHESNCFVCRAISAESSLGGQESDLGRADPVEATSLGNPPPNCS